MNQKKKKRRISLDHLGRPALLQLQEKGIDVRKQLARLDGQPVPPEAPAPRAHKFGVSIAADRTIDGLVFDSKLEMSAYKLLVQWNVQFDRQPSFVIEEGFEHAGKKHRAVSYVADFLIKGNGEDYVVDMKGMLTDVFKLKRKLFIKKFSRDLHCIKSVNELANFLAEKNLIRRSP